MLRPTSRLIRHCPSSWVAFSTCLFAITAGMPAQAAPLVIPQAPLFLSTAADPNIMLLIDNSGSMNNALPDTPYVAATNYGTTCLASEALPGGQEIRIHVTSSGEPYFENNGSNYAWGITAGTTPVGGNDLTKKCFDPSEKYRAALYANNGATGSQKRADGYGPAEYTGHYLNWYFGSAPTDWGTGARIKTDGASPIQKRRIEVAKAAATSLVTSLNEVRLGLSVYNNDKGANFRAGIDNIATNRGTVQTEIGNISASGYTPLAESLRDIGQYFAKGSTDNLIIHPGQSIASGDKFDQASVSQTNFFQRSYTQDFNGLTQPPIQYFCQKNFAVILTDGRPTTDKDIGDLLKDYDGDCTAPIPYSCDTDDDRKPTALGYSYEYEGSDYLDDVAQALHDIDLRPDLKDAANKQVKNNLDTYIIGFADPVLKNDKLANDAATQGGGKFIAAENADQLAAAFQETLADILSKKGSGSAIATNSSRITTDARIFQATFDSSDWSGSLSAFSLNTAADEKADTTKKEGTIKQQVWSAKIPVPSSRKIFTWKDATTKGISFEWNNPPPPTSPTPLSAAQQTIIGSKTLLDFLRGDTSKETRNTATGDAVRYRNRTFCDPIAGDTSYTLCLGDIVNFDPLFVGGLNFGYELLPDGAAGRDTYTAYRNANKKTRTAMVYAGANDGMLHAFVAATGVEKFAYIPNAVFPKLPELAKANYSHRYFVDGPATVGDAYFDGAWHTILVGTTGAGGRAVFALDVTDPDNFGASKALWEFTDPDLGLTMSQPIVARMQDGQWVAIFGNGYNSDNQHAVLFIVDLRDGTLIKKIDTGAGSATTPNGLATAVLIPDANRTVIHAYAGDLLGNLWKFDLSGATPGTWDVAFSKKPLFKAENPVGVAQPITSAPDVALHPEGGYLVTFGTGKYLENADNKVPASPAVQSLYGIWDKGSAFPGTDHRSSLLKQTIDKEVSESGFSWRVISNNTVQAAHLGWYLDLISPVDIKKGELVTAAPRITDDGRVQFLTYIPSSEPCKPEGDSWLMQLDLLSGARLSFSVFDVDNDGKFENTNDDKVETSVGTEDLPSGVRVQPGATDNFGGMAGSSKDILVGSTLPGDRPTISIRGGLTSGRQSWRQLY